jgi:hypothetical protein
MSERHMDIFWLFLAFSSGGMAGFVLFAALQMSRETSRKRRAAPNPAFMAFEFEADTISRM